MKTLFSALCAIFLVLWTTSCGNFLTEDPKGRLSTENFFKGEKDLEMALHSLYSLANDVARSFSGGANLISIAGDDFSTHPASNKQPPREFDQYSVADNNAWMPSGWQRMWRLIKDANYIINCADRTPGVSEADLQYAIAQAAYWRAFSYFVLVRTWGPLPIVLDEQRNYEAPLNSIEEVYELIVDDLKTAEGCRINYTQAPFVLNGRNVGVSQAAAKATLANVYLSMAGWPLNKGVEYYQLAAAKALEVINGVENGTYNNALLDEYWKIHSVEYNNNNTELILGMYLNRTLNPNPGPPGDFPLEINGWGDTNGEIKFWKNFPEGPRKDATYFPQIFLKDGELHDWWWDTDPPSREIVAPIFMKYMESGVAGQEFDYESFPYYFGTNGEKHLQIIRLAEVYCWYAEAVGRAGQTNAKAIEVLNIVRNRADGFGPVADRSTAGVPDRPHVDKYVNEYPGGMSAGDLAEAAYNEHGWEIAGYMRGPVATRYHDMFRMYRVKDHFEFRKENPLIEVAPGIFRKEAVPVPIANDPGDWNDNRMYAPYPSADALLNPNLKR